MKTESITKQVFLSYTRKDSALANALARELQRQGLKVWDEQNISPGADLSEEIKKALNDSDSMIALLNQHSFSSSYVRNELQHAFFDDRYKNRLLPVLISSTSDADFVNLPWVLTKITFLKITEQRSAEDMAKTIAKKFIALLESHRSKQ
ncbi:MAG: toll/interleukin-1 receptor domain-containing protein [Dissulfurispiraceae bacterium]